MVGSPSDLAPKIKKKANEIGTTFFDIGQVKERLDSVLDTKELLSKEDMPSV